MRLGIFQISGGGLTPTERLDALTRHLEDSDLDLILCPELFMSGYNVGADHAALAEPSTGAFSARIADIAKRHNTAIVYGYPEAADNVIYNSAAFIGADGTLLGNHRKRLASPHSFEETTFANGAAATFVDYMDLRISIIICYEVEFPESLRLAANSGAHLVLVPTALVAQWGFVAEKMVPTRAFESGLWVAYANHAGHENGFDYLGGSRIVAPDGREEAVAGTNECLIHATIDRARVMAARDRLPYLRDAPNIK